MFRARVLLWARDHNTEVYVMPLLLLPDKKVCGACTKVWRQMFGEPGCRGDFIFYCEYILFNISPSNLF